MKKLNPEQFQDTDFVRVSSLPFDQMERIKDWLGEAAFFAIGNDPNCIHFDDYEFWFDHIMDEHFDTELSLI